MKAAAVLLLLSALVTVARGACDSTMMSTCLNRYQSIAQSGTTVGLCRASQTYYDCLVNSCPGGVPPSVVDSIKQQLQVAGIDCVTVARGACDSTMMSTCLNRYQSIAQSGTTVELCRASQTYYDCLVNSCPGGVPPSVVDSIKQQLQVAGIDCVLSGAGQSGAGRNGAGRNGAARLGQSSLLLVAAALFLSIFLRG